MRHRITWHGHANFQLGPEGGPSVVIDPFFAGNPTAVSAWRDIEPPQGVLVTHDHGDHMGQVVELATHMETRPMVGAIVETAAKLIDLGAPVEQVMNHGMGWNVGGTVALGEGEGRVACTMVQACHSSATGQAVGYILTFADGFTVYHAGDTGIFSEMELWGRLYDIDVALLPIGGVFTMDARQAALACKLLGVRGVVPMHWGTFPVLEQNTEAFRGKLELAAPEVRLFAMKPGETVTLDPAKADCGCD